MNIKTKLQNLPPKPAGRGLTHVKKEKVLAQIGFLSVPKKRITRGPSQLEMLAWLPGWGIKRGMNTFLGVVRKQAL